MDHTVDVSKPVHNEELVKAIEVLRAEGKEEDRNQVLFQVMRAQLLAPIETEGEPVSHEDGTATFGEGTKASFSMLVNARGESYYPAFTDWEELHKWRNEEGKNQKALVFSFSEYATLILSGKGGEAAGFVVNPFGGNLTISKALIIALLKEQEKVKVDKVKAVKDTKVLLGEPNHEPTEIKKAISSVLRDYKMVQSARLLLKMDQERITKSWLLVLEFRGEEQKEVYDRITEEVHPYLQSMYLDMISLEDCDGMEIESMTKPFYSRKGILGHLLA